MDELKTPNGQEQFDLDDLEHGEESGNEVDRSRTWMLLLYEDSTDIPSFIKKLRELDWDYVGIKHDKDARKTHHHIVLIFKDTKTASAISKAIDLETRWMRVWDSKRKAFRYLCHKDHPHKFQYDVSELYGSISDTAANSCTKGDKIKEAEEIDQIISLLDEIKQPVLYVDFLRIVNSKGLFAPFRRMGNFAIRLLDEHNQQFQVCYGYDVNAKTHMLSWEQSVQNAFFRGFCHGHEQGVNEAQNQSVLARENNNMGDLL